MAERKIKLALQSNVARLLDANLNRAREGLRVVEDSARFIWKDASLYKRLRRVRHRLHELTQDRFKDFLKARSSETDAGRTLIEGPRASLSAMVAANMRRAQEAMRVLEEYSKVFSPTASAEFKKIRFQLYSEEKKIFRKL